MCHFSCSGKAAYPPAKCTTSPSSHSTSFLPPSPPPEANRFAALLQPARNLVAEGTLLANPLGKVLEVHQIGASRDQLNEVQAPPGPGGKKGRRGPPPV